MFCLLITHRYIEPLNPSNCFMCFHVYLPIKGSTFYIQSSLVCLYLSLKKDRDFTTLTYFSSYPGRSVFTARYKLTPEIQFSSIVDIKQLYQTTSFSHIQSLFSPEIFYSSVSQFSHGFLWSD